MITDKNSTSFKVLKGVSTQTLITIILGVLEIVSFSIMSRLLSEKDFGYYAAIMAIVTIFQSFAETGIGSAIVQRKTLDGNYVNNAFSMSFIFGFIISLTLFASANLLARAVADTSMTVPLRIISITLLCNCLTSVNISLLQRKLQFLKIGLINISALVITTLIAIFLAAKGFGYYAIIAKGVLTSIITLILSYLIVGNRFKLEFNIKTYREIFGFGGWLMAAAIFRNVASQVDRLLMTTLFSVQTLGLYTRPKEFISTIAGKCNTIFDTVLFPVLSTIQDNKESLAKSFKSGCYILNLFAMLLSVSFFFNSELLIRIFFGDKWMNIDTLFKVLSFYPVLLINGRMGDIFLRSLALTRQQFFFRVGQLIFAVVFILSCYQMGVVALALSVMLSYCCITVLKVFYVIHKMEISKSIVFLTMFKSYQFSIILAPFYLACYYLLSNTWTGNIIQAFVFVVTIFMLFLFFPSIVGKQYKEIVYYKINEFINKKNKRR